MLKEIIVSTLLQLFFLAIGFFSGWYFEKTSLDRYNKCVGAVDHALQNTLILNNDYHYDLYRQILAQSAYSCIREFSSVE